MTCRPEREVRSARQRGSGQWDLRVIVLIKDDGVPGNTAMILVHGQWRCPLSPPQSSSTKPHGPWGRVLLCMVCIDVLAGTVLRGFFALLTTRGFNRGCQASKGSKAKRKQKKQPMMTRTDPPNLSREHWRARRCVRPRNGSGIQDR